jgi:hypothetical protein
VRNVYAVDWIIGLIAAVLSIPAIVGMLRRAKARQISTPNYSHPDSAIPGQKLSLSPMQFVALALALNALTMWQTWFGSFGPGTSQFLNHVEWNNGDLYRLCIFIPATLMMWGLLIAAMCGLWVSSRSSARRVA